MEFNMIDILKIVELKKKFTKGQLREYRLQLNYLYQDSKDTEGSIRLAYKRAMKVA